MNPFSCAVFLDSADRVQWHHSTFAAWCRNDGAYKTKARPYMSWNAELLGPVNKDLARAWQLFDDGVSTANENCFTALIALVDGIGKDLAGKRLRSYHAPFELD